MKGISGVSGAGPIFHRTLERTHKSKPATWFPKAEGIRRVTIDTRTSKKVTKDFDPKFVVSEWLSAGKTIPSAIPSDYDENGRALLPPAYRAWFESEQNLRRNKLALDPAAKTTVPLEVNRPRN